MAKDFLRISRSSVDDSITQNLNALMTPAQAGFDPTSTSSRQQRSAERRLIEPRSCQQFKDQVLFPSWQTRSNVLNYCAVIATSPDPEDPDAVLRQAETAHDKERIVDERLDPYSARFFPREARTEVLANIVRNERGVERIIRERSWALIGERCGNSDEAWEGALDRWRKTQEQRRR